MNISYVTYFNSIRKVLLCNLYCIFIYFTCKVSVTLSLSLSLSLSLPNSIPSLLKAICPPEIPSNKLNTFITLYLHINY
uniref:Uncharacterized protein n=1 Tax=Phage sp. ctGns7 TaxID=2828003 RepID=A0A8S5S9A9_9VIRU|nr:MAG TPA: hypothetical protein [Phage sp. ctGns7]